jgi:hypothetical protein
MAMGTTEYSGRVRGMGLGPLLVRPTFRSPASSASRLSQEAVFNNRMNEMMEKWEEERRKMNERLEEDKRRADEENRKADEERRRADEDRRKTDEQIAVQSRVIENMQKMIESFASDNAALVGNTSATQDTESPNVVRVKPSIASRPG